MSVAPTAALLTAAAVVLSARSGRPARRVARASVRRRRSRPDAGPPPAAVTVALATAAGLVLMPVVGTAPGLAAGFVVAAVGRRRRSTDAEVDVPLVSDLLASCLAAGASVPAALRAAAEAAPTGRERCLQVAERLLHGAPPEEAWATWLERPSLAPVARVLLRSAGTGAATTGEIRRAAERARTLRRAELARRAQRAGVWAVLPLGLCFLPAFVLVGVVPFALSLFGR